MEISKEEAEKLHDSKFWEGMDYKQRAMFQMFTRKLCMPFSVFHEAMEKTLNRSIFTHEFGLNYDGLIKELLGEKPAPTLQEIIELIPAEKLVIIKR